MAFQHDQGWIGMWKKDGNGSWELQAIVSAWHSGDPTTTAPPSYALELIVSRNDSSGTPVFQPGMNLEDYTYVRIKEAADLVGLFNNRNTWESLQLLADESFATGTSWTGYRIDSGFDSVPPGTSDATFGLPTTTAASAYQILDTTAPPAARLAGRLGFYSGPSVGSSFQLGETYKLENALNPNDLDHRFPFDTSKLLIQPDTSSTVLESAFNAGTFLRCYSVVSPVTASAVDHHPWPTWATPPANNAYLRVPHHSRPSSNPSYTDFMNDKGTAGDAAEWQLSAAPSSP